MSHPTAPPWGTAVSGDASPALLRRLIDASMVLHACRDVTAVLHHAAVATKDLTGADTGAAWLWDSARGRFTQRAGAGPGADEMPVAFARHVVAEGHCAVAPDGRGPLLGKSPEAPVSAIAGMPVPGDGEVVGVLMAANHSGRSLADAPTTMAPLAGLVASAVRSTRYMARLRQTSDIRDLMLRLAAHEVRRPLSTMSAHLELLEDNIPTPGGREELLARIREAVDDMSSLTEDVLGYERLVGGAPLTLATFDVNAVARRAVSRASPRGVSDIADEPLLVVGDERLLTDALVNLVDNALKYSPDDSPIEVRSCRIGDDVMISVRDAGPGIRPDDHDRIFEPFVRLPSAAGVRGTGLGLSFVKAVAEAHGGRVSIESSPGKGALFTVHLPAGAATAGPSDGGQETATDSCATAAEAGPQALGMGPG